MTIEQIKMKKQYGDYEILGKILGINAAASKQRFLRGDEVAKNALEKIIESRESLIDQFKK